MDNFKQIQIQKMKNLSDIIKTDLDTLSCNIDLIKKDFDKSATDKYFNIKHMDRWQCNVMKNIASDIQKANDELWAIGQCLEQFEKIYQKHNITSKD